ncbi:metallophosphoesterase [Paludisphaera rhizosphaerae]|uniref:metallophosphoesterase n=1 Tax=Paludisphaera rhizosphaerae TaxID=2711216 RepID=UPI0013ED2141|nr:metallophosphoesterase [Paludisphaera rhizosphaerae]
MILPDDVEYPIIAVGDLHGQRDELERLVELLERLPDWSSCSLVFLGDFVDRGPDVRGTIDLVMELLRRPAGGSAVMGNHDLALVRAAGLDGSEPSFYWSVRYRIAYDADPTFQSYLGRAARPRGTGWLDDVRQFRETIPPEHAAFLTNLRWVVEAEGHLFLHCGLSPELTADARQQLIALRAREWEREFLKPTIGSDTELLWLDEYPVWLGADRSLSESPLRFPGKIQVTGHDRVRKPEVDAVRIRLDTSGGYGRPTACLLRSADASPEFIRADD